MLIHQLSVLTQHHYLNGLNASMGSRGPNPSPVMYNGGWGLGRGSPPLYTTGEGVWGLVPPTVSTGGGGGRVKGVARTG